MKKLIITALIALVAFSSCAQKTEKQEDRSTYYLIRHAEKDRSDSTNKDPDLNTKGLQRAENWASHLKDVKFDAVYATDYSRTKETGLPTAKTNNLDIQIYDPSDMKIEEFIKKTKGQTVLIVGHSNTTPKFVNALLGEEQYEDMADNNNANLYMVILTKNGKTSQVSVID